jgi:hypothetical protein
LVSAFASDLSPDAVTAAVLVVVVVDSPVLDEVVVAVEVVASLDFVCELLLQPASDNPSSSMAAATLVTPVHPSSVLFKINRSSN